MKKILFVFTNPRVCEKIIPVIPRCSELFELHGLLIGQMSLDTPWPGDIDERLEFVSSYRTYFTKFINGPHVNKHGESLRGNILDHVNLSEYDLIILDDNRCMPEYQLPKLYELAKKHNIPVVGNSHGNQDIKEATKNLGLGVSFDTLFVMGTSEKKKYQDIFPRYDVYAVGIPSNDGIKNYRGAGRIEDPYLLVIPNFLGNRHSPFPVNFDHSWINTIRSTAQKRNLSIVVKQKTRLDDPNWKLNCDYIKSILPEASIVTNCSDLNKLVGEASCVISACSTLAIKAIQAWKPIILINGTGQLGNLANWDVLHDIDSVGIESTLDVLYYPQRFGHQYSEIWGEFVESAVEGGNDWNSTEIYVNTLKQILNEA